MHAVSLHDTLQTMSVEMFNEAIRAAKSGQRRRARDLLTRLIKTDPEKVDYWVWLSSVVDSEKEQLFCLQKAIKLDPNSIAARRGLVMLGALSPEEAALPRTLTLDDLRPSPPVSRAAQAAGNFWADPRNRVLALLAVAVLSLAVVLSALALRFLAPQAWNAIFNPPRVVVITPPTATATLMPTPTVTPTETPRVETCGLPAQVNPAIPLSTYLCVPEPTPRPFVPTESVLPVQEAYRLVRDAYFRGHWDAVLRLSDQAKNAAPDSPYPYFYLAEALRNQGGAANLRAAANEYAQALARNSSFAPALYGRALTRLAQANGNEALRDLDRTLQADPAFVPALVLRAEIFSANANFPRALQDLQQAQALAADDANVLARLALAYADNGRPQEALAQAEQALALDPTHVVGYYARGRVLLETGTPEVAARDLAIASAYLTNPAGLRRWFPAAAALNFGNAYAARVLTAYGRALAATGQDEAALTTLNDALSRFAALPAARITRGQLLLQAGRYEDARADFNAVIAALQRNTDDPLLLEAYLGNGEALLATDRPEGALSNFIAATRLAPQNLTAQIGLGRAYLAAGQADKAVETLTAVLTNENAATAESAQARLWRARAYEALGKRAEAAADWQALTETDTPPEVAATAAAALTAFSPPGTLTPQMPAPGATSTPTPTAKVTPGATRTPTITLTSAFTPGTTQTSMTPTPATTAGAT
ncbi:MAG: tetratricopeptide repeat protein, partial [Anaerolineales bacterium]|nr:tetratricopeptide repeat protein [Anaerolineales bacterium]